jgi:hypothetical protein
MLCSCVILGLRVCCTSGAQLLHAHVVALVPEFAAMTSEACMLEMNAGWLPVQQHAGIVQPLRSDPPRSHGSYN